MSEVVYVAALDAEPEGGYSVDFPDVPGAITQGDTFEEALANARDALESILETYEGALPAPSEPARLMRKLLREGRLPATVAADLPAKAVRVNISLDETLLARIDRAAEDAGKTRSAFLAEAARHAMRRGGGSRST